MFYKEKKLYEVQQISIYLHTSKKEFILLIFNLNNSYQHDKQLLFCF